MTRVGKSPPLQTITLNLSWAEQKKLLNWKQVVDEQNINSLEISNL